MKSDLDGDFIVGDPLPTKFRMISEDEIRETFYNLMLENALRQDPRYLRERLTDPSSKPSVLRFLISESVRNICESATEKGFPTMRSNWITVENVAPSFRDLFRTLEKLRLLSLVRDPRAGAGAGAGVRAGDRAGEEMSRGLAQLVAEIEKRGTFRQIIEQFIVFYLDSQREEKKAVVTVETIRDTFYNIMVDQVLVLNLVSKQDIKDNEPYVFFALSSQAIVASVIDSADSTGIRLHNRALVTADNCPPEYKDMFAILSVIKARIRAMDREGDRDSPERLALIKLLSVNNPDVEIPAHLARHKTRELMEIVTLITNLAIKISQVQHFKDVIGNVLTFCLEALG